MKTKMKLSAFVAAALLMASCQKSELKNVNQAMPGGTQSGQADKVSIVGTGEGCVTLLAGQNINAGSLCFDDVDTDNDNIDDALKVTYSTVNDWEINEIHFWIDDELATLPTNKAGNPMPGQFPIKATNLGTTTYTFLVSFSSLGYNGASHNFHVAAHAALRKNVSGTWQTESAWGAGDRIVTKGNWATRFSINITPDETPVSDNNCTETAWAYSAMTGTCFSALSSVVGENLSNNWGWSNSFATGTASNITTMALYAGAGGCNISNGTLVGSLIINYNGNGSATITYSVIEGYSMTEIHLYAGSTVLHYRTGNNSGYTVSPGQLPVKQGFSTPVTSYSAVVSGLSEATSYVTAHAVVKGFSCPVQ